MKFIWTLTILSTFSSFGLSHGQTQKIKVKKEDSKYTEYKSDTCNFKVIIGKDINGKSLVLNSLDVNDNSENTISKNKSYQSLFPYLTQYIDIGPLSIQKMFLNVCKIEGYKLKSVEVKKHPTITPQYQNRVDIFLTYLK